MKKVFLTIACAAVVTGLYASDDSWHTHTVTVSGTERSIADLIKADRVGLSYGDETAGEAVFKTDQKYGFIYLQWQRTAQALPVGGGVVEVPVAFGADDVKLLMRGCRFAQSVAELSGKPLPELVTAVLARGTAEDCQVIGITMIVIDFVTPIINSVKYREQLIGNGVRDLPDYIDINWMLALTA